MYEKLTTNVLKRFLQDNKFENVEEVFDGHCRLPNHTDVDNQGVRGVEWDGVLTADKEGKGYLFLLEAKKTQSYLQMKDLPERVALTVSFIKNSGAILEKTVSKIEKARCYQWSLFKSCDVRGVLAADVIPDEAKEMVRSHQYITIEASNAGYSVMMNGAS